MSSIVDICNFALLALGQDRIESLRENSEQARQCNTRYESVRDSVLRAHLWNCASTRVSLAALSNSPTFGFDYQYLMPADLLRVQTIYDSAEVELNGESDEWRVEGQNILTNASAPIYLLYIRRLTDTTQFDPLLVEAISARLAAELAYPITRSTTLRNEMWAIYEAKMTEARGVDAREGTPTQKWTSSRWLASRE